MVHPPIWMVAGKLTTPHYKKFSSTECQKWSPTWKVYPQYVPLH